MRWATAIVHCGSAAIAAASSTTVSLAHIEELAAVAPLHNRPALEARARAREALPDAPHVAVSDSDFHRTLPDEASPYALPAALGAVIRLGFHGLAVQSVSRARGRGARSSSAISAAAARSPRSGTAAPSTRRWDTPRSRARRWPPAQARSTPARFFICSASRFTVDELDRIAQRGVRPAALGGLDDPLGFAHFTYRLAKAVAAMATALGGIDVLAFSGGVGENRGDVREAVAGRLRHLGDFRVEAVPAREEIVIARAVRALLAHD